MYKHFKYSNYNSINIDLALNPKEIENWVDTNIHNINQHDYLKDNIKWVTSILFKKDNELIVSNLTYVIDSYSFINKDNIIVNNIPYLYFIKSINILKQSKLSTTVLTEINELETKIDEMTSGNKEAMQEEKLKLFKQQSYYLSILSEIQLKTQLELETTDLSSLETLIKQSTINRFNNNTTNPNSNSVVNRAILTKDYYTYYSYSTIFINTCKIYTNNKNKKMSLIKPVINNMLNTIYYEQTRYQFNTNTQIPSIISDNINLLYSKNSNHYLLVLIYYLLDYLLILKLTEKFTQTQLSINDIYINTIRDILNSELVDMITTNKMYTETIPKLLKLCNNTQIIIPTLFEENVYIDDNRYNFKDLLFNRIELDHNFNIYIKVMV